MLKDQRYWILVLPFLTIGLLQTGLLGLSRPLFVDETILIDSGVSFWQHGWSATRSNTWAFDPAVTSGVLGSIFPGAVAALTGSYEWGRLACALQDSLALGAVGFLLTQLTGFFTTGLFFVWAALLIPAFSASLVYPHSEFLCFTLFVFGSLLYTRNKFVLAGVVFALAFHMKLLVATLLFGGVLSGIFYRKFLLRPSSTWKSLLVNHSFLMMGFGGSVLVWHLYQIAVTPTFANYLDSWDRFFFWFRAAGSGGEYYHDYSRIELLFSKSEVGQMSLMAKMSILLLMAALPLAIFLKTLRKLGTKKFSLLPSIQKNELFYVVLMGGAFTTLMWWIFLSEDFWIRHAFLPLLCCAAVLSGVIQSLVNFYQIQTKGLLLALFLLLPTAFYKMRSIANELAHKKHICPSFEIIDQSHCDPKDQYYRFRSWDFKIPE